jgi:outer membrane receptor protein involved in Fe transport
MGTGTWTRSDLSNDLQFDETVHAAYAVMSQGVGKFDLQGGLRAEYASRTFSLTSPDRRYPYDYASLFPSGVASYNLSDVTQLKASYSRRIPPARHAGAEPIPIVLRRAERILR